MLSWTSYSSKSDVIKCKKDIKMFFWQNVSQHYLRKKPECHSNLGGLIEALIVTFGFCKILSAKLTKSFDENWSAYADKVFFPIKPSASPREVT